MSKKLLFIFLLFLTPIIVLASTNQTQGGPVLGGESFSNSTTLESNYISTNSIFSIPASSTNFIAEESTEFQEFAPVLNFTVPPTSEIVNYNNTQINVTSNKKVKECFLEWGGVNESMAVISTYNGTTASKESTDGNFTIQVYCEDWYNNTGSTTEFWRYIDTLPPGSIVNLVRQSSNSTNLVIEWTNPVDSEQTEIWLNGSYVTTVDVNTTEYTFNGLTPDSDYLVSLRAIDIALNLGLFTNETLSTIYGELPAWEDYSDNKDSAECMRTGYLMNGSRCFLGILYDELGDKVWNYPDGRYINGEIP